MKQPTQNRERRRPSEANERTSASRADALDADLAAKADETVSRYRNTLRELGR